MTPNTSTTAPQICRYRSYNSQDFTREIISRFHRSLSKLPHRTASLSMDTNYISYEVLILYPEFYISRGDLRKQMHGTHYSQGKFTLYFSQVSDAK